MTPCPFDGPATGIGLDDACPVCGDLGTGEGPDGVSRCGTGDAHLSPPPKPLPLSPEMVAAAIAIAASMRA